MGSDVLVQSKSSFYYSNEIANPNITSFKKAYEGTVMDGKGNHKGYNDSEGLLTIGYGNLYEEGRTI